MSVLMPGDGDGGRYTVEPATSADVDDLYDLVAAELTDAFGFCPYTVEDVRSDLEPPEGSLSEQRLVRDGADGALVQWWAGLQLPGEPTFHAWVRSHPRLDAPVGDELARVGWTTLLDWVREVAPPDQEVRVRSGSAAGNEHGHRRLEAAGFSFERTVWEMTGPVTDENPSRAPVEGLTIVSAPDDRAVRAVHAVINEAFTGHWGYEPLGFEDWLAQERSVGGHDPGLWRLALLEGTPAGAMIMTRRAASSGALYVAELATLAPYRGRGIASVLLGHAFDVAAAEGYQQVWLHVDSQNAHNAPSVYRRAGMDVRCAFHAFTTVLRDGAGPGQVP